MIAAPLLLAATTSTLLTPTVTRPGYSIQRVSATVPAAVVTQPQPAGSTVTSSPSLTTPPTSTRQ